VRYIRIPQGNEGGVALYDVEDTHRAGREKYMCSATLNDAVMIVTALNLVYDHEDESVAKEA